MICDYNSLADSSKVFVFPAERNLREAEKEKIDLAMRSFLEGLSSVECSLEIRNNRFLIVVISDETKLNLDQHDQLIENVARLEADLGLSLIDKVYVFYKQGEFIQRKGIPDFQKMIKQGAVSKTTQVFDLMVQQKYDLKNFWLLPASESWLSYMFRK